MPSMETRLTEDALLGGRVRLLQPSRGYRVAVDAVLLAAAVDAAPGERVLDLGAGVGCGGAVPCPRAGLHHRWHRTAIRSGGPGRAQRRSQRCRQPDAHDRPRHRPPAAPDMAHFDHVVTNPPYLAAAVADPSPNRSKALATVESSAESGPLAGGGDRCTQIYRNLDGHSSQRQHWRRSSPTSHGSAAAISRSSGCRPPRAFWFVPGGRGAGRHEFTTTRPASVRRGIHRAGRGDPASCAPLDF